VFGAVRLRGLGKECTQEIRRTDGNTNFKNMKSEIGEEEERRIGGGGGEEEA
jgi:hypothetical protein